MQRILTAVFCISILAPLTVLAEDNVTPQSKFAVGGRMLYYFSQGGEATGKENVCNNTIEVFNTNKKNGPAYDLNLTYLPIPNISLELGAGYFNTSVKARDHLDVIDGAGNVIDEIEFEGDNLGRLTSIPLSLTVQYRLSPNGPFDPPEYPFIPYIGTGVVYLFNEFDTNSDFDERFEDYFRGLNPNVDVDADIEVKNSWGWVLNVGFDWFITKNLAFNVDGRYIKSTAPFRMKIKGNDHAGRLGMEIRRDPDRRGRNQVLFLGAKKNDQHSIPD